ncbi:UNVERIFIED_CONTAM: hypothetical protein Slati_3665900 [Sesamum latifolium]|uniref:RNase H type-1 domain-containing protein n=1 Tax=Sesamum latifolium TaxID=2727402 RepID=A0AAW2U237_9LAMI
MIAPQATPACWSPPGDGWIKLNLAGIIALDFAGVYVWRKSVRKRWQIEPKLVEAFAAREAIYLACRSGWRKIILKGNCANTHIKLSSPQLDCSAIGVVTQDIKHLATYFECCVFSQIRRSSNKVAHFLPRNASNIMLGGSVFSPSLLVHLLFSIG